MLQAARSMITLRTITQKSPKGASTSDKNLHPLKVAPGIMSTISWTKEGGAVIKTHTLEASVGKGTKIMSPQKVEDPEATGMRMQREL